MADIALVIKIPEEKYKWIKENILRTNKNSIVEAIINGTILNECESDDITFKDDNAVSRLSVRDIIYANAYELEYPDSSSEYVVNRDELIKYLMELPTTKENLVDAEDCISREKACYDLNKFRASLSTSFDKGKYEQFCEGLDYATAYIDTMPSVYPKSDKHSIDYEKCPYYNPDIMFDGEDEYDVGYCTYKPKSDKPSGKWEIKKLTLANLLVCSDCGAEINITEAEHLDYYKKHFRFCPYCGLKKMESEDNNE